jgi:hypothetical protein
MVLEYLPTKLGDFVRANVGKYSSTMEHLGTETQKLEGFSSQTIIFSVGWASDLVIYQHFTNQSAGRLQKKCR